MSTLGPLETYDSDEDALVVTMVPHPNPAAGTTLVPATLLPGTLLSGEVSITDTDGDTMVFKLSSDGSRVEEFHNGALEIDDVLYIEMDREMGTVKDCNRHFTVKCEERQAKMDALTVLMESVGVAIMSALVPKVHIEPAEALRDEARQDAADTPCDEKSVQLDSNQETSHRLGMRVYTQGDAEVANTLVRDTPKARGPLLLAAKMHDSQLVLSEEQSVEVLLAGIKCGLKASEQARGKELLMVVGNTGVGKSLTVNYIHGCKMERVALPGSIDKVMRVSEGASRKEIMQIGHTNQSMTFIPQLQEDEDFTYLDCPGFLDNRGSEINIANAVNIKSTVTNSSGVRVVMLINYNSLKTDRGAGLPEALKVLKSLFGDSLAKACDSIQLGVTHVPLMDAEGEEKMTLDDVGRLFQDTSKVTGELALVLSKLSQRLFIYHPMDKGHSSWLKRDELIKLLNELPPIRDPLDTFHTVLTVEDCDMLRCIVKTLKDRSLDAMKEDRFVDVRETLQYMESIEIVQHAFASTLVNEAKEEARRYLQSLSDKVWDNSSHGRFEEAQQSLNRLTLAAQHLLPHPLGIEAGQHRDTACERLEAQKALADRQKTLADREQQELASRVRTLESRLLTAVTPTRVTYSSHRLECCHCNNTASTSCSHQLCGKCCSGCSHHKYTRDDQCRDCSNRAAQDCPRNCCGTCCNWYACPRHG